MRTETVAAANGCAHLGSCNPCEQDAQYGAFESAVVGDPQYKGQGREQQQWHPQPAQRLADQQAASKCHEGIATRQCAIQVKHRQSPCHLLTGGSLPGKWQDGQAAFPDAASCRST
jgi:hypothetical protein